MRLAVLPLKDTVIYPHGMMTLIVGTPRSVRAIKAMTGDDRHILLVAKRDGDIERPSRKHVFEVGTIATVLQALPQPGKIKALVEGERRARIVRYNGRGAYIEADVEPIEEPILPERRSKEMVDAVMERFADYVSETGGLPDDVLAAVGGIDKPGRLIDTIAAEIELDLEGAQSILEAFSLKLRKERLFECMEAKIATAYVDQSIRGRVKQQMEKNQRDYYLHEKMKAIQDELGQAGEAPDEFNDMEKEINASGMSQEARGQAISELGKLRMMPPMSAEATVVRNYLDWMIRLPWKKKSRVRRDLHVAQRILDEDHYGLEEVKERILEYLAVQGRVKHVKGPVLCLVGPPGVGKTSLGESVARATNRRFVRMALGGVRDEAEIRGHRRTYIGSMPGKILQKMARAGVRNPLFLLDEIDKMGMDIRGDPASALLEVLDPEQNNTFSDHYIETDYDLSDVFFICTSNSMNIPPALLDRMEVIRLPGYTEDEKINIAQRFLVPKQKKLSGLAEQGLDVDEEALRHLVRYYTKEAGVRNLERELAKLARKVVTAEALGDKPLGRAVTVADLEHYNGVRKFTDTSIGGKNRVGIVNGLAYTEVGGELLNIEAVSVPGKGRQIKTGSLGDVMQESIQAAMTFVRSRAGVLGIAPDFHKERDIHIHVPEGATPKDGPSAGIGMCMALVSVLTDIPVCADVAMTGEITLRGQVLPVGGLKEKLLAAHRGGIRRVVIPAENERNLQEIPDNIKEDLEILTVGWMDEVIDIALESAPVPRTDADKPPPEAGEGPFDQQKHLSIDTH